MLTKTKILVVDDDPSIRKLLAHRLASGQYKYEIIEAENGKEGLKLIKSERVDLVLLDMEMPELDGLMTFEIIQKEKNPPPVVLLTAHGSFDLVLQFMRNGGSDYIAKPFHIAEIDFRIQKALEVKKAQVALNEAKTISAIGRMTASIAHEMRQPLTAADVDLAFVLETLGDGEAREFVETARGNVKEALLIVRSMMKMFRGGKRISAEIDINNELDGMLRLLARKTKGVEIIREFGENITTWSCANFSRIFVNIIDNALDVLKGQGRLRIATYSEADQLVVEIEDDGFGIPADSLREIFNPNFTTKKSGEGTGLGLWITKQETESAGSKIIVESEEGYFAKFTIIIPRRTKEECVDCDEKEEK